MSRSDVARALRGGVSAAALTAALAAGLVLGPCPAWANGGAGGAGVTAGVGGVDGSLPGATGGNSLGSRASGGGGGGVDLTTGNGAPGGSGGLGSSPGVAGVTGAPGQIDTTATTITGTVSGGIGGAGAVGTTNQSNPQAGGAGGGGVGVSATADVTVTAGGAVRGGAGLGTGAASTTSGGGGGGGVGIFSSANVTIQSGGAATGGAGGSGTGVGGGGGGAAAIVLTSGGMVQNGGGLTGGVGGISPFALGGTGGNGGAGVQLLSGGTVVNTGTITGGAGGVGHVASGVGGAGIMGANINVINAGTITGGAGAQAILFTGGVNSLELQSGTNITGNVTAFSTADTFKLGGTAAVSFAVSQIGPTAKYQGFGQYVKTGTGTATLTGTTTAVTPWTLAQGVLSIDNDAELGAASGGLTFDGGTLQTTTSFTSARAVALAGDGTFAPATGTTLTLSSSVTGAGGLTVAGAGELLLQAVNSYTGTTTVASGTLALSGTGSISQSSGVVVASGATFDISGITPINTSITTLSGSGTVNLGNAGLVLSNASGVFAGTIQGTTTGGLVVAGGSETLTGTSTLGGITLQGASALTIEGGAVTANSLQLPFGSGPSTLTVENGGRLTVGTGFSFIANGGQGSLIVTGPGSQLQVSAALQLSNSSAAPGSLTIADGATAALSTLSLGPQVGADTAPITVQVTGAGSSLTASTAININKGTLSVLDGAQATTAALKIGSAGTGNLLVSGAGSSVTVNGATTVGVFGATGIGDLTLQDGGVFNANGAFTLASAAAGTGVLNIGGAVGQAATAAGTLNAATAAFGPGTGQINFNHTDANYSFAPAITGTGAINQVAGVTHLTANSSGFIGTATVSGGALLVDGTLGGATSSVAVTGGQLGGVGTIGGNVTLTGGALTPGDSGPGTLTIAGNLTLGSGAVLQMDLGQAGVAGGALNDLVVVDGNLTLGGTLDVSQSAGGAFGNGIYRLIDYSGTLTDNTLAIGSIPTGNGAIQTSIANQVNLVVSGGPSFSFWDGGGQTNDGVVTGGTGTWEATNDQNWTNTAGTANGSYAKGSLAIFAGQAGTVTVDDSVGQVQASGIQFAASGYDITGGSIALTGSQAELRVGDGTAAGAAFIDTISSQLTGTAQVVKTDLGTLVLTGLNLYTGGTAIDGGVLQISSDLNLGDASGGLSLNGGTLQTTANVFSSRAVSLDGAGTFSPNAGTTLNLGGVVSGAGSLTVAGAGTVVLIGADTYTGGTTISSGTLQIGAGGPSGAITGDVVDNGTLAFDRSNILTFAGAISGSGAVNQIGPGSTTLTGNNTYTGLTTIGAGTLEIGDGGTSGAIVGDTVDNGILAFNRSDRLTYGGAVSGSGAVVQTGTGAVILTGDSTYTGGTDVAAGTLQLGNGGTSGSIVGDVTNDGTLAFDRSDAFTFTGVISGSGALNQLGTGTTILTAANSYAGGTIISGGTLQLGNGGTSGSIIGNVSDNGTLAFDRADEATFSGAISGSGSVSQLGSGQTTLAGVNTYTGGTLISAGTLVGSATSFGTGAIVDNAALVIDQPADPDFANAISGSGTFTKTGNGTLTLTGVNTYAGGTTISGGTLVGSATSFGMGAIVDNAVLVIEQPTDANFGNPINGSGSFTKTGAGDLDYTGTGTLSGPTMVSAGRLTVDGSLAASPVTVLSDAVLGGSGTVGAATIQGGATVAPGAATTTLHVNGAFAQAAGSTYQAVLDPNSNASSLIAVSGAAALAPGAGLNVTKAVAGDYRPGVVYTVLNASGGVSGSYTLSGDTGPISAFLALKDSYDANHAFLSVVQTSDPSSVATTPNQGAVAGALPASGGVTTGVLNSSSDAAARQLLDELAADGHAAAKGVLVSDSRLIRDLAVDRLQAVLCASAQTLDRQGTPATADGGCAEGAGGLSSWGQVFGAWGHTDGNANAGNVSRSTGGFLLGLDAPLARQWRLGGFLGYSQTGLTMDARTSTADIDNYHVGAYGGGQLGPLGLRFGATYTTHDISTDRTVSLPSITDRLQANYTGHTLQGFAEVGWRLQAGRLGLEPFANAAHVTVHTASFTETGGAAALSGSASDTDATYTTLGVRPSMELALGPVRATLRGVLGWRHDFGDVAPTSTVRFVEGGNAFTVDGAPIARDAGVAEMALDLKTTDRTVLSFSYGAQGGGGDLDETIRANFHLAF